MHFSEFFNSTVSISYNIILHIAVMIHYLLLTINGKITPI